MPSTYARTLQRASEIVGGVEELSVRLNVPQHRLLAWIQGEGSVPTDVFLRAVDIVLAADGNPKPDSPPKR